MATHFSAEAIKEWRAHWKLVFSAVIGASTMSMSIPSFGAFMDPLQHAFGWGRGQISSGLILLSVAGILLAPLVGGAVDRFGPRRFGILGVLLIGASFALFGTVSASLVHWYALWVVFAIISQMDKQVVWAAAISSEFKASRGAAIGAVMVGAGLGTIASPLLAGYLIKSLGWRLAYVVMGFGWGGLAGMVCYFYFYGRTDRLKGLSNGKAPAAENLPGVSAREALTSMTFVKLACATLLVYTMIMAFWVHLIPLLTQDGISRTSAIMIASLLGVSAMVGQVTSGMLADRLPGNILFAGFACLPLLTYALFLMHTDSIPLLIIATFLIGTFGGAASQMFPYLTTRYFGLRSFGKIYGGIAACIGIGQGVGPLLAGYAYDRAQSYDPLLMTSIPAAIACILLVASLGRYPDDPRSLDKRVDLQRGEAVERN